MRINQSTRTSIGHWQLVFSVHREFMRNETGWYTAQLGIIKITSAPDEGVAIGRQNYDGFLWRFRFLVPFARGL